MRRIPERRPRARRALPFAVACAATAACSYVFEVPTGSVASPLVDGGGDGDLPELDANLYADPDASLRPPPPFCATKYPFLFCADFDGIVGPPLEDLGTASVHLGSLRVAEVLSLSPIRSLLATTDGKDASALFRPAITRTAPQLAVSASLLVSRFTSTNADLMAIELAPNGDAGGASRCFVRLTATTRWLVTQVCTKGDVETARLVQDTGRAVEERRWQTFVLSTTSLGTITLAMDGAIVANVAMVDPMLPTPSPQTATFGIERSADGAAAVFYDDMLVTESRP